MELPLTEPIEWDQRGSLPERAGVYVISFVYARKTIYIGRTWGAKGIRNRIRAFHRSATTGRKGHAGGVTFYSIFSGDTRGLRVAAHLADSIDPAPGILHPYISYAERRMIWEHVETYGALPACNSE